MHNREMQVKTTMRYHFTPNKMLKQKRLIICIVEDIEYLKLSCLASGNVKHCNYFERLEVSCDIIYIYPMNQQFHS